MPRLRQISRSETDSEVVINTYNLLFGDNDPVAEPGTATGTPGNWWTVFAMLPDILAHASQGFLIYRNLNVDPVLRELGQTRAGWLGGSQFVFSQHCKSCRALGLSEEKIAAIAAWGPSDLFSPVERAVLAYTDGLTIDRGRVHDKVFEVLKEHLTDEQILGLTYVIAMYVMHASISNALRLEFDDCPDRIVEVDGPGDAWSGLFTPGATPSPAG